LISLLLLSCLLQSPQGLEVSGLVAEAVREGQDRAALRRVENALVRSKGAAVGPIAAELPEATRTRRGVATLLRALERLGPEAAPGAEAVRASLPHLTDAELAIAGRIAANTLPFMPAGSGRAMSSGLTGEWTARLRSGVSQTPLIVQADVDRALVQCDEASDVNVGMSWQELAAKLARNVPVTRVAAARALARKLGVPDEERRRALREALASSDDRHVAKALAGGNPADGFELAVAKDVIDLGLAADDAPLRSAALRVLAIADRDPVVRGEAVKALVVLRGVDSRDLLVSAARDRDASVVRAVIDAIVALGEGGKPLRWILYDLREHEDETVAAAATAALAY
jgi:hypothetical protein